MSCTREFARGDKKNYSNEEKLALGELVNDIKKTERNGCIYSF